MTESKPAVLLIDPVGAHGFMDIFDVLLGNALQSQGVDFALDTSDIGSSIPNVNFISQFSFKKVYRTKSVFFKGIYFLTGSLRSNYFKKTKRNIGHLHVFKVGMNQIFLMFLIKISKGKLVVTWHDIIPLAGFSSGAILEDCFIFC